MKNIKYLLLGSVIILSTAFKISAVAAPTTRSQHATIHKRLRLAMQLADRNPSRIQAVLDAIEAAKASYFDFDFIPGKGLDSSLLYKARHTYNFAPETGIIQALEAAGATEQLRM